MEKGTEYNAHDPVDHHFLPVFSSESGTGVEVLPDVFCYTNQIANICCVGIKNSDDWVLIDAGMPESSHRILQVLEERFGEGNKPKAIILTHGHFDHVGAVKDLALKWDVKVYIHEAELPFVTGEMSYPEPDATVEGGLVAKMSRLFPNEPIDLSGHAEALPDDGSIPHMSEWKWIYTPGHSPGHVSLFRESDRTLIAGDAFVTVKQDSLYKVMTQEVEVNGPPRYLTTDWKAAWESVKKLEALHPEIAVTGHGKPLAGEELKSGLSRLVKEFDRVAIPDYGRFVDREH